jgi:hypothetical protein
MTRAIELLAFVVIISWIPLTALLHFAILSQLTPEAHARARHFASMPHFLSPDLLTPLGRGLRTFVRWHAVAALIVVVGLIAHDALRPRPAPASASEPLIATSPSAPTPQSAPPAGP